MTTPHFSWNKLLAWVGGITAIITLFFSLREFTGFFTSNAGRRQDVETLLASAALQSGHGQYRAAWDALAQADTLGQLEDKVTVARQDLAMRWLEDGHGTGADNSLGALADLVSPVLAKGAANASGNRKADLIAHLGWAEFYHWRDGARDSHPDEYYRQALGIDPGNGYAHAMLAHWTLWNHQSLDSVRSHFAAALSTDSARAFVRSLEIGGYRSLESLPGNTELVRVVAEMKRHREPVPVDAQGGFWDVHWSCFVTTLAECDAARLRGALPAAEHLATWDWLMAGSGFPAAKGLQYELVEARLEEAAGQTAEAAAIYRKIQPEAKEYDTRIKARIAEGLKRTAKQ
jgi:hypothetical protein